MDDYLPPADGRNAREEITSCGAGMCMSMTWIVRGRCCEFEDVVDLLLVRQ